MADATQPDPLIAKLDELERRATEITDQMNDPDIASVSTKVIALSKEQARLSKIVDPYRNYRTIAIQIDDAQAMLDDPDTDEEFREMAAEEITELRPQAHAAFEIVQGLLVMSDDTSIGSVMLEIRAGAGGDEAALFAGDLFRMYRHHAEAHKWSFETLQATPTEMGGFREVVVNIKGPEVWARLGYEGGGHRVQRDRFPDTTLRHCAAYRDVLRNARCSCRCPCRRRRLLRQRRFHHARRRLDCCCVPQRPGRRGRARL